ncbi:MAG: hypothetical protein AB1546_05175 [bacterium]
MKGKVAFVSISLIFLLTILCHSEKNEKRFYYLESIHDERHYWPCPRPEVWLVSKDWTKKHHISTQNDDFVTKNNWSPNDNFLITKKGIFDAKKNRFVKADIFPDWCTSFWNIDNKLLFIKEQKWLYSLNPETGISDLKYHFHEFSIEATESCYKVHYGEGCCGGVFGIKRKGEHLVAVAFKNNEAWRFRFDENGNFVDKKKLTDCDEHDYDYYELE